MNNSFSLSKHLRLPFQIQIEERTDEAPKWLSPLLTLISVVVALIFSGILIA